MSIFSRFASHGLAACALSLGLGLGCFTGESLRSEPCQDDAACGPRLHCMEGLCGVSAFTCGAGVQVSIANIRPNVVFILDRSGSMSEPSEADAEQSRWQVLRAIVTAIVVRFDGSMNFGLVQFPAADASPNQVDRACNSNLSPSVPVSPDNGGALLAAIPIEGQPEGDDPFVPAGAAPMAAAVKIAREHLIEDLDHQLTKAIVVISDSTANCSESAVTISEKLETLDTDLQAQIVEAAAEGIPTFIVGIDIADELTPNDALDPDAPGDGQPDAINPFEIFGELATLGGSARPGQVRFYRASDLDELLDRLAELPDAILDCSLPLEPAPDYPGLIEVEVDGSLIEYRQAPTCEGDGYRFSEDSLGEIILCGDACDRFQSSGEFSVRYRCPN
ncbi:MAG TPA: VWA domain-containing protein [Nannocystis exedens]|nr:VWA domain-containing protein [Nannocystis exedens]